MREVVRAVLRSRQRRLLVVGGGLAALAAAVTAVLLFGLAGLVGVLVGVQALTLAALMQTRVALMRSSTEAVRAVRRRFERELRHRDTRLTALWQRSERLADLLATEHIDHARSLADRGDLSEAAGAFERALELVTDDPGLRQGHVDVLVRLGKHGAEERFLAAVERQRKLHNFGHVRELAQAGLEVVPNSGRLHDHLVASLDILGKADEALELAVAGARTHLDRFLARRGDITPAVQLTPQQRVFISGFFYSGSSAVLDHLRGFDGAVVWPRSEMRLIKFPGGLADIGKRLRANGELAAADLVDLYLHITGSKVVTTPAGSYDKWRVVNRASRRLFERDLDQSMGFLTTLLRGYLEVVRLAQDSALTVEVFERHFRAVLQDGLDAVATDLGATHVVVDQAVTAWRMDIARFVPSSSFVVVHRDPRDQFAEARAAVSQPGRSQRNAKTATFADNYRRNREFVAEQVPQLEQRPGHRFLRLGFEEFVLEHDAADARIRGFLGLGADQQRERRFHPERSQVNVGKYAALLADEEIAELGAALGEFCSPLAERAARERGDELPKRGSALGWERG